MGGGLVGDQMWFNFAPGELGQDLRRIAEQPDRSRFSRGAGLTDERERLVDVLRLHVQITRLQAHLDARRLALDRQQRRARHRRRQRLRAAHAAQARGQDPFVGEIAGVVLAARFGESLVGSLYDALAADINP